MHAQGKSWPKQSFDRYLSEELRLVRAIMALSQPPYAVQVYSRLSGKYLELMFTTDEIKQINRLKSHKIVTDDPNYYERVVRAGIRELASVLIYFEHHKLVMEPAHDLAINFYFQGDATIGSIKSRLLRRGLYLA